MKKRLSLLALSLALIGVLCFWFLSSDDLCIGGIEEQTDTQWSHIHAYMNGTRTVQIPVTGENQNWVFQWETGRGSFDAEITDATGAVIYAITSAENGSATVHASSDMTLTLRSEGHGGVFALFYRGEPVLYPGEEEPSYGFQTEGTHSGGKFTATYDLRKVNGKYVNFFVENRGTGTVVISINGEYDRIIPAGSSAHTTAPISVSISPQPMTVNCVSENGEEMEIYWKVAQRAKK